MIFTIHFGVKSSIFLVQHPYAVINQTHQKGRLKRAKIALLKPNKIQPPDLPGPTNRPTFPSHSNMGKMGPNPNTIYRG